MPFVAWFIGVMNSIVTVLDAAAVSYHTIVL
jgi:hypothetical protein